MKIDVIQDGSSPFQQPLLSYQSDICPLVGDGYAGICFNDGYGRTITRRLLFPSSPNCINVYVNYTYPNLVPKYTELNNSTEMDLVTTLS